MNQSALDLAQRKNWMQAYAWILILAENLALVSVLGISSSGNFRAKLYKWGQVLNYLLGSNLCLKCKRKRWWLWQYPYILQNILAGACPFSHIIAVSVIVCLEPLTTAMIAHWQLNPWAPSQEVPTNFFLPNFNIPYPSATLPFQGNEWKTFFFFPQMTVLWTFTLWKWECSVFESLQSAERTEFISTQSMVRENLESPIPKWVSSH